MNFPNFPWFLHPKIMENLRIASYLSFAANACGAAVNSGALCAGDWTALMANFGEMATVGAAVKEDCDFGKAGAAAPAIRRASWLGKLYWRSTRGVLNGSFFGAKGSGTSFWRCGKK